MLNISVDEWLDKDTGEAVLLVSDNDINFLVFCPCYIEKDRKMAQHCQYYLPEIGTLTDLTYLKPFDIVDDMFELEKEHADNLSDLFGNKLEK